jgi:macrolide-specific efflux system membrane fusion protein
MAAQESQTATAEVTGEDETAQVSAKPRRKKSKRKWFVIVGVVVLAVIGGVAAWYFTQPTQPQAFGNRTFTATAELSTQTVTVSLTGTLAPKQRADLSFSVAGDVTNVFVEVGDTVEKGDKLAQVDSADLQNAVDLAKANVKSAKADYEEVVDNGGSSAAKTAAKARIESAQAALDKAEEDLDSAVLTSTITGTIAQVNVSVGDQVSGSGGSSSSGSGSSMPGASSSGSGSTSTQIVVIGTSTWKLEGTVGSADLASVQKGQPVKVTPDEATEAIDGEVTEVGIVATSTYDGTAEFPVTIELTGEHPELYSGTNADAVITVGEYPDVLTVPTMAVSNNGDQATVTLMVNGEETEQPVTVGQVFGDSTEITEGLKEGDEVVVNFRMGGGSGAGMPTTGTGGPVIMGGGMGGAGGGVVITEERGPGGMGGGRPGR